MRRYFIWILIFTFGFFYSVLSVFKHLRFETNLFDLGIYDQIIWQASRFQPLFSSILDYHPWGDHFTPTLLLLAPLFWIWNNVVILLVFQAFFACLGAWPICQIAFKKTKNFWFSIILSLGYLLFFGISYAIDFDFHPIVLASTLFAFLLYLYELSVSSSRDKKLFWLVFILFLGLQENFSLLTFAFGLVLIIKREFKLGFLVSLFSLIYFLFSVFLVIPHFAQAQSLYLPTHWQKQGIGEIIKSFFLPTSKLKVTFFSFSSFGFLSLLSPTSLILLLEEFFQRFVGNPSANRWVIYYQYNIMLVPILSYGVIDAYAKIPKKILIILLFSGILLTQIYLRPAIWKLADLSFYNLQKGKEIQEVLNLIPKDATVAASNNLGAHLAHRQGIVLLTNCQEDETLIFEDIKRCFNLQPEYLVADLSENENDFYPDGKEKIKRYFDLVLSNRSYQLVIRKNSTYLLKKHGSS